MSRVPFGGLRWMIIGLLAGCGSSPVHPSRSASTVDQPVGNWMFVEGQGQTVADTSGRGNPGVLGALATPDDYDPVWLGEPGAAFKPLKYVRVPNASALEPSVVSVEAWVRGSASPGPYTYIVAKGGQDCAWSSYALLSGDGGLLFYAFDGAGQQHSPEAPPEAVWDGQWHLATGTYDGVTPRLYLDGQEVGRPTAATQGGPIQYGLDVSNDLYIGNYGGDCDLPFTGSVRGVRIYDRALSSAEVQTRFDTPFLPPVTPICPVGRDCGPPPPLDPPGDSVATFIPIKAFTDAWHQLLSGSDLYISTTQGVAPGPHKWCQIVPATAAEIAVCKANCGTGSQEAARCKAGCNQLTDCSPQCSDTSELGFFKPSFALGLASAFTCQNPSDSCPPCNPGQLRGGDDIQRISFDLPPFWVLLTLWKCQLTRLEFAIDQTFPVAFTDKGLEVSLIGAVDVPAVTCDSSYDFDVHQPTIKLTFKPKMDGNQVTFGADVDFTADVSVNGRWDPVAANMAHDQIVGKAKDAVNGFLGQQLGGRSIRDSLALVMNQVVQQNLPKPAGQLNGVTWNSAGLTIYTHGCSCDNRSCGDDGCGRSCGGCPAGKQCDGVHGQCVCAPKCDGKSCGADGCGGSCGGCNEDQMCTAQGQCCVPHCKAFNACGDNGCGGSCGICPFGKACSGGSCVCVPQCNGKTCGPDGCGGSCGSCGAGSSCSGGQCQCQSTCVDTQQCHVDNCGYPCGKCPGKDTFCDVVGGKAKCFH